MNLKQAPFSKLFYANFSYESWIPKIGAPHHALSGWVGAELFQVTEISPLHVWTLSVWGSLRLFFRDTAAAHTGGTPLGFLGVGPISQGSHPILISRGSRPQGSSSNLTPFQLLSCLPCDARNSPSSLLSPLSLFPQSSARCSPQLPPALDPFLLSCFSALHQH